MSRSTGWGSAPVSEKSRGVGWAGDKSDTTGKPSGKRPEERAKPPIVVMSHEHWVIRTITEHPALIEHVAVRPLIREAGGNAVTREEIEAAFAGANVLMIGVCKRSMVKGTDVCEAESYAIRLAKEKGMWIVLFAASQDIPDYFAGVESQVRMIIAFGNPTELLRRHFLLVGKHDLHDLFARPDGKVISWSNSPIAWEQTVPRHLDRIGQTLVQFAEHQEAV